MGTLHLLPDDILQKQVCQNCFQYLSVPPICINKQGSIICGRCFDETTDIPSFFTAIAEGFSFKCTNHLNGCKTILSLAETAAHEETCIYEKQECFFCSFSGNISQILNHCLQFHPENVSTNGKISFLLSDETFQKSVLLVINGNIFQSTFNLTTDLFTVIMSPITSQVLPTTINQYRIQFFKSDDLDYIHTDYALFNNTETFFKKSKEELHTLFGPIAKLTFAVLLQQFPLSEKEFEIEQRYAKLQRSEEQLSNSRSKVQAAAQELSQKQRFYDSAMNVIKRMSYDLFKCCSCKKIIFKGFYVCPKNHGCCEACLTNVCTACQSVTEFNKLEDMDNFLVSCDWLGCNKNVLYKDYLNHKSECLRRSYKCPLLNCLEVIFSSQKLIEHWHCTVPTLTDTKVIEVNKKMATEYYWLIECDLYHVLIDFNDSDIKVLISEINVLPNNITFQCASENNSKLKMLTFSTFCGKFQVMTKTSYEIDYEYDGYGYSTGVPKYETYDNLKIFY